MLRDFRQVSVGCLDAVRESDSTPTAQRTAARLNSFVPILENSGHTWRAERDPALRGGRALGLIAGRIRPPNGLSRIYQGTLESLYGATFNPPFRCLAR